MRRSRKTYHTEPMLLKIYRALKEDLELPTHGWFSNQKWFDSPRIYTGPGYLYWKPYEFKVMYQLQHFFKRVLLTTDRSFDELAKESFTGFIANQQNYGMPELNSRTRRVTERARDICHGILGEFDFNRFAELCSFGRRAAAGLPFRRSYLDVRVASLNGSRTQLEWFKAILCSDIHLHRACRLPLKTFTTVDTLQLCAVPKTFKSTRIIAPDTILGGFLSRGLGAYIRERLEGGTHIDLRSQQYRHRKLAKAASLDGYLATIDMSKASDSFVWEHMEALVPKSWLPILDAVRTPRVNVDGTIVECRSVMLMGSGHTFPLQTLLFYSIVKAVMELMGSHGTCDVYGDDILFPSQYSFYVLQSMTELGFSINEDKSFVDGPFRESCGGDYHTGVDVRPFMPEHVCGEVTAYEYTECLHKWLNGLLERWTYEEIPTACELIYYELIQLWGNLCLVPVEETDFAGVKFIPAKLASFAKPWDYSRGYPRYLKLVRKPKRRKPSKERIYYWYSLRRHLDKPDVYESDNGNSILDPKGLEAKKGSSTVRWLGSHCDTSADSA